ncbi:MAG: tail-specific protease [Desulfobacteraceae bacterium]|nr:tail-specific protease [Desulfobacteraceae bacterium]
MRLFKFFKHHINLTLASILFLSAILAFSSGLTAKGTSSNNLSFSKEHQSTCIKIIAALERYHYLGKKLDNEMSANILKRYLKRLDPSKQLFTVEDINHFSKRRYRYDDDLKKGKLSHGFEVFNLYLVRSKQRFLYILNCIDTWEQDLNFTKEEAIVIDDDAKDWQRDLAALKVLWKKDLKNYILSLRLDGQDNKKITETLNKTYPNRLKRLSQINASDAFQILMNTVTSSFDPHTQFFPPRVSEDFDIHMSLSLEGIGAVLQNEYEYTKVVRLIPKGPADKSNLLMPGDKIIGVGQGKTGDIKDTIGQRIDNVVKLIRGPKNTYVRLKIIPASAKKSSSTKTISILREKVKLEEQSAKKKIVTINLDNNNYKIGIIEIPNFYIDFNAYHNGNKDYKSTTKDVKRLLKELRKEKIDGLIVDLRDNGGGSLKEASQLTGLFLKTGPTVQIKTKFRISRLYDEDPAMEYNGPLIVLIDRMSASASEIFAGAIKDYNRGIIVGTRSFGKGTVQELQPLGKGKLKLTSAKFYRISGKSTQNLGIVPDIQYPQIYKVEDTGESSLEGALPWDTTVKTSYDAYQDISSSLTILRQKHEKRSFSDPGLQYLKKRLELMSKLDEETQLSLNEQERRDRKEKIEQHELEIENSFLVASNKTPIKEISQRETRIDDYKDILLKETQMVMADFINTSKDMDYRW